MMIHILHEMAKGNGKEQISSLGKKMDFWSQADLAANPSPALSKLLNFSDSYLPSL